MHLPTTSHARTAAVQQYHAGVTEHVGLPFCVAVDFCVSHPNMLVCMTSWLQAPCVKELPRKPSGTRYTHENERDW